MGLYPTHTYPIPHTYDSRPQHLPQLSVYTAFPPQHSSVPAPAPAAYMQAPSSANRHNMYPFPPTVFDQRYVPSPADPWAPSYRPPQPPPEPLRRTSFSGSAIEYPQVPIGYHRAPPYSAIDPPPRRPSIHNNERRVLLPAEEFDEDVFFDGENFYWDRDRDVERERLDRQRMPPPPRPAIRHSVTASSAATHRMQPPSPQHARPSSPRKLSLESSRPASRPPPPSSHHGPGADRHRDAIADAPPSPAARRRAHQLRPGGGAAARPQSFHGGARHHLERQVEEYQARRNGTAQRLPLTAEAAVDQALRGKRADAVVVAKTASASASAKPSKAAAAASGPSETASRGSSSRDGSDVKARPSVEKHRSSTSRAAGDGGGGGGGGAGDGGASEGFSVKVPVAAWAEGRVIRFRHSKEGDGGIELSIGGSGASGGRAPRDGGRPRERTVDTPARKSERRASVAGKRDVRDERAALRDEAAAVHGVAADPPALALPSTVASSGSRREPSRRRERSVRREPSVRRAASSRRRSRSRAVADEAAPDEVVRDEHQGVSLLDEGELTDEFRRLRVAEGMSRRSSRSAASARSVVERAAVEGSAG